MSKVAMYSESDGFADKFADIERRLATLETTHPGAWGGDGVNAYLKNGNAIVDGGKIQILDASGNVLVDLDSAGVDIFESDGSVLVAITGTGIRLNDGAGTKLIDLTKAGLKAYEADGSELVVLDGGKLRFNRSDGTRQLEITPAGGLKIYDAAGTGEKVVLDQDGLEVEGGPVRSLDVETDRADTSTATLTTTMSEKVSVTFTVPSWANSVLVTGIGRVQSGNDGTAMMGIRGEVRVDDVAVGDISQSDVAPGETMAVTVPRMFLNTSPGSTIKVSTYARRNAGSGDQSPVSVDIDATVVYLR